MADDRDRQRLGGAVGRQDLGLGIEQLRERGVVFTITSGRTPFGMRMLVEPLGLAMPMAAFNGGVIVLPELSVLDEGQRL